MNKVEISADAFADLEAGYDFYEKQEFDNRRDPEWIKRHLTKLSNRKP